MSAIKFCIYCDRAARPKGPECVQCRACNRNWDKRPVTDRMRWTRKVGVWSGRMNDMTTTSEITRFIKEQRLKTLKENRT